MDSQLSIVSKANRLRSRTVTVAVFCALLFTLRLPAEAQQLAKIPKIGIFSAGVGSGFGTERLKRDLAALGYVEGKSVTFEFRTADYKLDLFPVLADQLVRLKVDVIYATTVNAALAAKNATRAIPIVFNTSADPVVAGLVDSLARPGGNVTGFTYMTVVLAGKRIELVKETIPSLSHIAVLWNPKSPGSAQEWKESQTTAKELGLQLHSLQVSAVEDYERAFKDAIKARVGGLAVTLEALFTFHQKRIAEWATKNRLPGIYPRSDFVGSGGLMSYGADRAESFRRLASMVDKILKGTKPGDIPVEQSTKFEMVINLKTAKQIGLTIPQKVLARADRVIR